MLSDAIYHEPQNETLQDTRDKIRMEYNSSH